MAGLIEYFTDLFAVDSKLTGGVAAAAAAYLIQHSCDTPREGKPVAQGRPPWSLPALDRG